MYFALISIFFASVQTDGDIFEIGFYCSIFLLLVLAIISTKCLWDRMSYNTFYEDFIQGIEKVLHK